MTERMKMIPSLKSTWGFSRQRTAELPSYIESYLAAPRPDEHLPWRLVPYSVLDIETTGLNCKRDSVLSVGLVDIDEGRIRMDKQWYTLVRPPDDVVVPAESIRIHGLLRDDVATAPTFQEILPDLLSRLSGRVLVVHYAPIDVNFLNRALRQQWKVSLRGPAIDTILLAQMVYDYERWSSGEYAASQNATALSTLAQKSGIPIHAHHNALGDAITTAQLFLAQATRIEQFGSSTLRKLLRGGRCLR